MNYTYLSMPVQKEAISDIDYSQSNIGGNPAINVGTGRLQYVFEDVNVGAGDFAISVAHIYNSKLNEKFASKIVGLGKNWKLNLTQCVVEDNFGSDTGASILKYMDECGEIHRYVSYSVNKWYNDRKATSIIEKIDGNYVLSDGIGNKLYFNSNGYLFKSVSCQNVQSVKLYNYDTSNRLISVYDQRVLVNNVAKNRIELIYNADGKLEKMVSYLKNQPVVGCRYEYDTDDNLLTVFNLAYGAQQQVIAEKQVVKFRYENGNLSMIVNSETDGAILIQYDENGRVIRRSNGFVKRNNIASGMTDSSKNSFSLGNNVELGLSCDADYIEKSYNTFVYKFLSDKDIIAVETDVTNECNITLKYFIDRNACVTASFEVDKWFAKKGMNLKTLTKFEGQSGPSSTISNLGYINECGIFATDSGKFNRTLSPTRFVGGNPVHIESNFTYSFWLKIKKKYGLLEVKAVYKNQTVQNDPDKTKIILINSKAVGAWQRVTIPLVLAKTNNPINTYSMDVSFIANKSTVCKDDFEIAEIGLTPSPCAELMLAVKGKPNWPLSTVTKVKLSTEALSTETVNFSSDFYLTESDIISSYTNKYKSLTETFDLIYNNGTKRRSNITGIQFYAPLVEWLNYSGQEPFYIHTVMPVKDAYIKSHYIYGSDGFVIKNDYSKTIDGTSFASSASVKMDYKGKTIYESDEYGTTKNYQYDNWGNLVQLSVVNGTETQSIQKFEYDADGKLVSVDDGLTKQVISYNDVSQSQKIRDYSYQENILTETGHSLTSSIGIFRDKQVGATEYDGMSKIGSVNLTYEKGLIRTISDGSVKYGVQHNLLKDSVLYTQFDRQIEKPIQLDSVSEYFQRGGKYYRTHASKFYDSEGKIVDGSYVEVDAYGKPTRLEKGNSGTYKYDGVKAKEVYSYSYKSGQESEFAKKLSSCKNLNDYSTTEYKYDNDGNLIGWKETEASKTAFEVKQIAPTTTKYVFGNNEQEYFAQINHDKNKMASPRIESVIFQEDTKSDVDRPTDMFQVDYKWVSSGNLSESKTKLSTEKYSYLNLRNNLMLQKMEYNSRNTVSSVTWRTEASDDLSYYDNGLIKQETIKHQNFYSGLWGKSFDPIISTRTYQYDNLHRITKEVNTGLNVTRTYSYYPDGRLKKISGFRDDDVRNFTYDYLGRLVSVNNTTFRYDNFGNRISKTVHGVTTPYTYDVGGRLVEAGGVRYSYNADGIRCKKTCIGSSTGERMYLDGGKILGEDRANYKLRYFYDATGLKRIRKIKGNTSYDYECVKDSQGSIVMLVSLHSGAEVCRYEYDALGKCTILDKGNEIGDENPFRWKGFFYDSETGFYYANGSYYDPETGMYVDAAPISTVIDNAGSPRYIDRNGILCYNHLALAGSPYTAYTSLEMSEDPTYDPGKTWWEKNGKWIKIAIGVVLIVASIAIACATGGASIGPEAGLLGSASAAKVALIDLTIGIGFAAAGWAINAAATGNWDTNALENAVADAIFFTGLFLFVESAVGALKYAFRSKPTVIDGVEIQYAQQSDFTPEAWERIQSLNHRADGSTISTMTDGRLIHKGFKTSYIGKGKEKEILGVGRVDCIVGNTIYELKPNNAQSIIRGIKQLHRYSAGLGEEYKLVLVLY